MKAENIQDIYELSPAQQGILFHTLSSPDSGVYFVQLQCSLMGHFDIVAFENAWRQVVARHAALRTSFHWENLEKPLQVVHQEVKLPLRQQDWRGIAPAEQQKRLETLLESDRHKGFDLSQPPLLRLSLIQLTDYSYQFVWSKHHLILDGWSTALVLKEFSELYEALSHNQDKSLVPSRSYGEYIGWVQQQDLSKAETFWRRVLSGIKAPTPLIKLNIDKFSSQEDRYDEQFLKLSTETTAALQSLAKQRRLTLNTLVQGAWAVLLSRYSGDEEVVYGNTVSGRPADLVGIGSMVGMFINTLPVRVKVDAEQSLVSWLKQLQAQLAEMRQYEYSPLVEVKRWSEAPQSLPLFESIIVFENYPVSQVIQAQKTNLEVQDVSSVERTNYPLTVMVLPGLELELRISYQCSRFVATTISRMLGHFQVLLQGMVTNPAMLLKDLPLLTQAEKHQLLREWNNTQADYPQDQCVHQLFEAQAEKTPDAIAVVFETQQLTYRELNQRANRLAYCLRKLGVKPEVLVGICVERSIEMVMGLLGILKAGGAYVPIDPAYPQERLAFMLSDSQAPVLLTESKVLTALPKHSAKVLCLDTDWREIAQASTSNLINSTTPQNLAYVIYTSGSTGLPKGVQILHSALVNFLNAMGLTLGLGQKDTLLSVTTLSFDIAALEIYLPLMVGARLAVVSREVAVDGTQLLEQLTSSRATVMQATPATWRLLLSAGWPESGEDSRSLKILCGGEALNPELAVYLLKRSTELWNLYGPTETTIWSAAYKVNLQKSNSIGGEVISIGCPIANTKFYVLDQQQRPVPVGVIGELHIGGLGLARGYLNRLELTSEKFISNPFEEAPASRIYKTGDLVHYRPDGNLEYVGRIDHQVKIRGFRIELEEIEAILNHHPAVQESVVVVREDESGDQRLVAYVVLHLEQTLENAELRCFLQHKLPNYMAPTTFVRLEALPLTPNGKVDRRALPLPDWSQRNQEQTYVAPRTPVEEVIAGIWTQVLGVEQVSIDDNFFEQGGHSLLATRLISRLRTVFQIELPLRKIFEYPTVAALAESVEAMKRSQEGLQVPPIRPVSKDSNLPLSFAQERLWFLDQLEPNNTTYNMPSVVRLKGPLNLAALEQSFNQIVGRHEVLRTIFTVADGKPLQVITPTLTFKLPVIDLQALPETERETEVLRLAAQEADIPFDLGKDILLRVKLLQLGEAEHVMLFTMHHIVTDAWSNGVLIREISTLYPALCSGKSDRQPAKLSELSIQYADFAHWQRQWLQGEVLENQLSYWRQQLAGAPATMNLQQLAGALPLTTKKQECAAQSLLISTQLAEQLKILSRKQGATLFMTLLAAFQTLLLESGKKHMI